MNSRSSINTTVLQEKFPDVYRNFFIPCQKVASASHSFLWMGEFSGFYNGLTVAQKLPIRSYVGLETTFDKKVSINPHYFAYEGREDAFVAQTLDSRLQENIGEYLTHFFVNAKSFTGVKVHFLAEVPFGHSLGSHGAIAASLAQLLSPANTFDKQFDLAQDILSHIQSGHSSGVSAYTALAPGNTPIIFRHKENGWFVKSTDELVKISGHAIWPIDFALIYTGVQVNTESLILASNQTAEELNTVATNLTDLLNDNGKRDYRATFTQMLDMTTGMMIHALIELFAKGSNSTRLQALFNTLNQYQNLLHVLEVNNSTIDLIYSRIHSMADKQKNDVGSGVKISGMGRGGVMLCALPYGSHRHELLELMRSLQKETGKNIWLDYASWLDGIGGEAGKIEQDLTGGQHSSFVTKDTLSILALHKGIRQQKMITQEHYQSLAKQFDLLLDKTTDKLFIAGTPVTSKELPSQKATVAIVAKLIQNPKLTLANTEISDSYGVNRYDLQSKVVTPLMKQVKTITNRDLQLSIHGNMYENYTLSLDPSNVVIGIIESKL